jgi:hypothetical protein
MKSNNDIGFLVPFVFLTSGVYSVLQTEGRSEWYMDIVLVVGAMISVMGLTLLYWSAQRRFSIWRLGHRVRGHH